MEESMKPSARKSDLVVEFAGSDTLVYDKLRDVAHSLNPVTGYVFRNADGTRTIEELSADLSRDTGIEADAALISAALWELHRVNLLEGEAFVLEDVAKAEVSRREAIRRFGVAALAVVAVTTIAAPTPAMARSFGGINPGKSKGKAHGGPRKVNTRRNGPRNNPNAAKLVSKLKDVLRKLFG